MQEHFEGFATPVKDWPIMTSNAIKRRSEAFSILMRLDQAQEEDQDDNEEPF